MLLFFHNESSSEKWLSGNNTEVFFRLSLHAKESAHKQTAIGYHRAANEEQDVKHGHSTNEAQHRTHQWFLHRSRGEALSIRGSPDIQGEQESRERE